MKLNKLQQKIISVLEPVPVENKYLPSVSIIERSQIGINETVTGIWRSLRRGEPMNWDLSILKDGDVYRLFYSRGLQGQTPW